MQVHTPEDGGRTAGAGPARARGVRVWGCRDDCVPVCLRIYEPRGGGAQAGSRRPRLGMWNGGVGAVSTPSSLLTSRNLHSTPSADRTPIPTPWELGLSPPVPISLACSRGVWGGSPPAHPPWPRAHSPALSWPSGHSGGRGWQWGEALKAGDCLGELRDRAPIVPAPEPPQWSSAAQRGFDNGQAISMHSQPLGPLPVPQPRGESWGAAGPACGGRGRQGWDWSDLSPEGLPQGDSRGRLA